MANQKNYGLHVEGLGYDMTRLCLILLEQSSLALFFCSFPWFISKHRKAPPLMFNLSFQLIPVSSSSCRPINNLYGNIWLQPSVRCHHQSYTFIENFSMFRLHVHKLRGFCCLCKKRKKKKNTRAFGWYIGNRYHNFLQVWYSVYYWMQAPPQKIWFSLDKRSRRYECVKTRTLLSLLI